MQLCNISYQTFWHLCSHLPQGGWLFLHLPQPFCRINYHRSLGTRLQSSPAFVSVFFGILHERRPREGEIGRKLPIWPAARLGTHHIWRPYRNIPNFWENTIDFADKKRGEGAKKPKLSVDVICWSPLSWRAIIHVSPLSLSLAAVFACRCSRRWNYKVGRRVESLFTKQLFLEVFSSFLSR